MASDHAFSALHQHAEKIFKFQQGKTIPYIKPVLNADNALQASDWASLKDGVCAALIADWLNEKRTTTNGSGLLGTKKPNLQNRSYVGPSRSTDIHYSQNFTTVMRVAPAQAKYAANANQDALFSDAGLTPDIALNGQADDTQASGGCWVIYQNRRNSPEVDVPAILQRIVSRLGRHRGVYVAVRIDAGGHAIGFHKSRGDHLYFFDPNVGVYKVRDLTPCILAWLQGYVMKGRLISMRRSDSFCFFGD